MPVQSNHEKIIAMGNPALTVLGVFRPEISVETWDEQLAVIGDVERTREHFRTLVLIEALAEGLHAPFEMARFGQMDAEFPNDTQRMQVGYDEALLSRDGELLIERKIDCVYGTGVLRFTAYLHRYDPSRPLMWQEGEVTCPAIQDVPGRLKRLVPYFVCG